MKRILGISGYYHDSAAVLLRDGDIVAAAQEERFTRKKHDARFPKNAVNYVLDEAGLGIGDVDAIAFYDKPFLKFERLLETYTCESPRGFKSFAMAMPIWLREKLFQKNLLGSEIKDLFGIKKVPPILFSEHHLSHCASAFYPSPFEEAVVLTLDGVGEWTTSSVAIGKGHELSIEKEIHFPHSLGLIYSAFTYYIGFKVNSGEYKLMGLAPYGEPKYKDKILDNLVDVKDDGSYRTNQDYFAYTTDLKMINEKFCQLFGEPARRADQDPIEQFHMDIAASIQAALEEIVLKMARSLQREYDQKNLCLAGGVALNCVANGKIMREKIFEDVWIQPAAGDAGGALGAALAAWHIELGKERKVQPRDSMKGSLLGPEYPQAEIEKRLEGCGAKFQSVSGDEVYTKTAEHIAGGKAIGWFQGRMEFGPRALGARSIIGDARSPEMQKNLNLKVKFRESFRPFAPSILREDVSDWFEIDADSPYMLVVADVNKKVLVELPADHEKLFGLEKLNIPRSKVPAITHVDCSARVQTVSADRNEPYYKLISEFKKQTGCPVIINTSFNIRGEPIVCTPEDAFRCFMGTDLEVLVVGNAIMLKEEQNSELVKEYRDQFELD